jgi:Flp pilus assembly protein TadB
MRSVTALLLLVTFLLTVGSAAFLTYLVTDAKLTEDLRERVMTKLRGPAQEQFEQQLDDYRERVQEALTRDHAIPTDAPQPPADPLRVELFKCRWCAGLWVSFVVVLFARLALSASYPPLWYELPLRPLDLLVIPAWTFANAYFVGFLASREGD